MVRAGSSSGVPRPALAFPWLILPALGVAGCTAFAVVVASADARPFVAWCGAVATVAVALVAGEVARRGRALATLRDRYGQLEATLTSRLDRQRAETQWLAEVLLPEVVGRVQRGEFAEDVLAAYTKSATRHRSEIKDVHLNVVRTVLEAVSAEEDMRDSAQRAFVNIARRVQAIVHQQARGLREMEDRHGSDPEVFGDLLRLDHGTALIGRLADSIAVLGGARPGRQWQRAVPLFSVLRGAMSRILDYQRVELHSVSEIAIVGPAVEPLIHALSELLDNATRYSPPDTMVHLTAVEVQAGIAVEIEDGGVSLSEEARLRAERMLAQAQAGIDLNDLGETPRLGLAVVGRLSQAYGFQVSLRPSAYGGVRAVLIVPQRHLTTAAATGRAHGIGAVSVTQPDTSHPEISIPRPVTASRRPARPAATDDDVPVVTERTATGLPQRRRRSPVPSPRTRTVPVATAPVAASGAPAQAKDAVQPGMWLAAFHRGVSGDSPEDAAGPENSDESSDKGE